MSPTPIQTQTTLLCFLLFYPIQPEAKTFKENAQDNLSYLVETLCIYCFLYGDEEPNTI